jgi:hypothetical protein
MMPIYDRKNGKEGPLRASESAPKAGSGGSEVLWESYSA